MYKSIQIGDVMESLRVSILLFICVLQMDYNIYSCQENNEELAHKLVDARIITGAYYGNIYKVNLEKEQERFDIVLYRHIARGTCYFSPIIQHFESTQAINTETFLKKIYAQYLLFDAITEGKERYVHKAMEEGANINEYDRRDTSIIVFLQTHDRKAYTFTDIHNGDIRDMYVARSTKPSFAINTYLWTAAEFARNTPHFKILSIVFDYVRQSLIEEGGPEYDEVPTTGLHDTIKQYDEYNKQLIEMQKEQEIPTFIIERDENVVLNHSACTKRDVRAIKSVDDDKLEIGVLVTKDEVLISTFSAIKTWKQPLLDLDALAQVYAHVICYNDNYGKKIVHLFDHWNKNPIFTKKVLFYIKHQICLQYYDSDITPKLIPENVVLLANKALKIIPECPFLHLCLSTALRCFVVQKDNSVYHTAYNNLLKNMTQHSATRNLLKKVCTVQPKLFNDTVKPTLQEALLRTYLIAQLHSTTVNNDRAIQKNIASSNDNENKPWIYCLPKSIIAHIVSFWKPDEAFKNALKL